MNVGGTRQAIGLARAGNMALLYVSTAYVCGERSGPVHESGFANGYGASKAEAERLIHQSSVRWIVARPSIVLGDSRTGAIRQFDATYAAFKLIAEGQVRNIPAGPEASLDFVPIDHVALGISRLAERAAEADGGTFHLVSGQAIPMKEFVAMIGAYPQFSSPELIAPEQFDPAFLPPRERRLYRRVAGLYASYFQRNPRFDDSGFRAITGFGSPPTGSTYISRLIDHCIAAGFLNSGASAGAMPRRAAAEL